jgi:hypothetical protein
MIRTLLMSFASLAIAACAAPTPAAPASTAAAPHVSVSTLRIDGDAMPLDLRVEDLRQLSPVEFEWGHGGSTHHYVAVSLEALLRRAGLDPGAMNPSAAPAEKRASWKFVVVATASDGFQAVFSAAEIYRGMGRTEAFLAFAQDGQPLDASVGPFRLVVPTDGEASRCAHNVERLTIVDLRRVVPAR